MSVAGRPGNGTGQGRNCQQQIRKLFEIGSSNFYYIHGRTDGSIQSDYVVGPTQLSGAFFEQYGDGCQAEKNELVLTAKNFCSPDGRDTPRAKLKAKYCVIQGMSFQLQANDNLVFHSLAFQVGSLERS